MPANTSDDLAKVVYWLGAVVVGLCAFAASWWYAVNAYGWFLGIGLGWLPALCIGVLAGLCWPLLLAAAVLFYLYRTK